MKLVRLIAAGLILFSCSAMGLIIASSYGKRVFNLRQLITLIQMLESEINFARSVLPEIIKSEAAQFSGETRKFLDTLNNHLADATGENFSTIWEHGVVGLAQGGMPNLVLEDMLACGRILGTSDTNEQTKHLKILLIRLEQALKIAEEERGKHTRLWQYLGFSAGLLIVLLLL